MNKFISVAAEFREWVHAVDVKKNDVMLKKFTAFGKTFFEVCLVKNNLIYNWIYVLALPDEAKHFYFHANIKVNIIS